MNAIWSVGSLSEVPFSSIHGTSFELLMAYSLASYPPKSSGRPLYQEFATIAWQILQQCLGQRTSDLSHILQGETIVFEHRGTNESIFAHWRNWFECRTFGASSAWNQNLPKCNIFSRLRPRYPGVWKILTTVSKNHGMDKNLTGSRSRLQALSSRHEMAWDRRFREQQRDLEHFLQLEKSVLSLWCNECRQTVGANGNVKPCICCQRGCASCGASNCH